MFIPTINDVINSMTDSERNKKTRLEISLQAQHKIYFQKIYELAGYNSLSSFFISAALDKATQIAEVENKILASQKDREIFFTALINPAQPNEALVKAAKNFKKILNT